MYLATVKVGCNLSQASPLLSILNEGFRGTFSLFVELHPLLCRKNRETILGKVPIKGEG